MRLEIIIIGNKKTTGKISEFQNWSFVKIKRQTFSQNYQEKKRELKSEVKEETLQQIPQKYKGLQETMGYPGSDTKESACNAGDLGSIPGWGKSHGEGNDNPLPVFLPGEFHGQRNLVGYSPWSCKQLDTIKQLTVALSWEIVCPQFDDLEEVDKFLETHNLPRLNHEVKI